MLQVRRALTPRQKRVLVFLKDGEGSRGYERDQFFIDVATQLRIHDPLPVIRILCQKGYARYDNPSRRHPQGCYKSTPQAHGQRRHPLINPPN